MDAAQVATGQMDITLVEDKSSTESPAALSVELTLYMHPTVYNVRLHEWNVERMQAIAAGESFRDRKPVHPSKEKLRTGMSFLVQQCWV